MNWDVISALAENVEDNKKFGLYLDSIVTGELTHERSFNVQPPVPYQDPTTIFSKKTDFPFPTRMTLPMTGHALREGKQKKLSNISIPTLHK